MMPKVGSKHYAYTKAGEAAAKKEAAKTGMPMKMTHAAFVQRAMRAAEPAGWPRAFFAWPRARSVRHYSRQQGPSPEQRYLNAAGSGCPLAVYALAVRHMTEAIEGADGGGRSEHSV